MKTPISYAVLLGCALACARQPVDPATGRVAQESCPVDVDGGSPSWGNATALGAAPSCADGVVALGGAQLYTAPITPGATYRVTLTGLIDNADLSIGESPGTVALCSSLVGKDSDECLVRASAGASLLYVRVSAAFAAVAPKYRLCVEPLASQGTQPSPLALGAPPIDVPITAVTGATSYYSLTLQPDTPYLILVSDWNNHGVATLSVIEPGTGGNLPPCQISLSLTNRGACAVNPTSSPLTLQVSVSGIAGTSARLRVFAAVAEGSSSTPVNLGTAPAVHEGMVPPLGASYYEATVSPGTSYVVSARAAYDSLQLRVEDGYSPYTTLCFDDALNAEDTSCQATATSDRLRIVMTPYSSDGSPYVLGVYPASSRVTAPVQHAPEGRPVTPVDLGTSPLAPRWSSVDDTSSYYRISDTPGATRTIAVQDANGDVDLYVYSDPRYRQRLCASVADWVSAESCQVTVPGSGVLYIRASGIWADNGGRWSNNSLHTVGAAFRLEVGP